MVGVQLVTPTTWAHQAAEAVAGASFADRGGSRAEYLAYQIQVALLMLFRQAAGRRRVYGAVVDNVRMHVHTNLQETMLLLRSTLLAW